jgi:hypothetical protein
MKQHRSFKKDIDLLSEAYGRIGGIHMSNLAQQAAGHLAAEDGEDHDKTGHDSDHEILKKAEEAHTAGRGLLSKAHDELETHGSLSPETRDAVSRDVNAKWAQDDDPHAKDHNEDEQENENDELNITQGGGTGPSAFGQEERTGY